MAAEQFVSYDITDKGREIIARVLGGLEITFKRIAIGDGFDYDIGNFVKKTALVNEIISLPNLSMKITNSQFVELTAEFAQADTEKSFWYREIGLYIVDPDDETKEILFAYGNKNDIADYITPHIQNYSVLKDIKCITSVGNSANVRVLVSTSAATKIDFASTEWTLNEITGVYSLYIGAISNEAVKVFKSENESIKDMGMVEITKNSFSETILKSLSPFDGYLVCV